ncbi:hypothetical protein KI387_033994, partial [Taxus chinensis]
EIGQVLVQAVYGTVGTSGCMGCEKMNRSKEGKIFLSLVSRGLGHPGQKYARDANRLIRPKQETFVRGSSGHPGQ